ncbi:hypothetical protein KIPB_003152 [Kipferlia bialata]|uniref:Uncharacterized protein n=1 Tax=Kipferlia bialata TaxID=797122 RepID=A0A9K3CRS6_9EUKA|nr:hypothetical protein KIPB_003152 [Kipferlia bialata]|eukprot:g3152.t1
MDGTPTDTGTAKYQGTSWGLRGDIPHMDSPDILEGSGITLDPSDYGLEAEVAQTAADKMAQVKGWCATLNTGLEGTTTSAMMSCLDGLVGCVTGADQETQRYLVTHCLPVCIQTVQRGVYQYDQQHIGSGTAEEDTEVTECDATNSALMPVLASTLSLLSLLLPLVAAEDTTAKKGDTSSLPIGLFLSLLPDLLVDTVQLYRVDSGVTEVEPVAQRAAECLLSLCTSVTLWDDAQGGRDGVTKGLLDNAARVGALGRVLAALARKNRTGGHALYVTVDDVQGRIREMMECV